MTKEQYKEELLAHVQRRPDASCLNNLDYQAYTDNCGNTVISAMGSQGFVDQLYTRDEWDDLLSEVNKVCNECLEKLKAQSYDDVTVPDTEEFRQSYERYAKYAPKMNELEYARYREFNKRHAHRDISRGAIGCSSAVTYVGTGLGTIVSCSCPICGASADITDNDSW